MVFITGVLHTGGSEPEAYVERTPCLGGAIGSSSYRLNFPAGTHSLVRLASVRGRWLSVAHSLEKLEFVFDHAISSGVVVHQDVSKPACSDSLSVLIDGLGLHLRRTDYMMTPLFFSANKDSFVFSTQQKPLWSTVGEPIKELAPGCALDVDSELNVAIRDGSDRSPPRVNRSMPFHEAVETLERSLVSSFAPVVGETGAVLFSGGLDSSLAAMVAGRVLKKTVLVTCGAELSKDSLWAPEAADLLGLPLSLIEMSPEVVWEVLPEVIYSTERSSRMDIEIALPFLLASKGARKLGIDLVISGQGPDEMFAGYARYGDVLQESGPEGLERELWADFSRTHTANVERDEQAILFSGCDPFLPYMEKSFVDVALSIPGDMKLHGGAGGRKWILRELAANMGLPSRIASRPKKATQYSSGSAKALVDACRRNLMDSAGKTRREANRLVQSVLNRISLELGQPKSSQSMSGSPKFDMEPTYRLLQSLGTPSRPQ